jgi:hypothetical protein
LTRKAVIEISLELVIANWSYVPDSVIAQIWVSA